MIHSYHFSVLNCPGMLLCTVKQLLPSTPEVAACQWWDPFILHTHTPILYYLFNTHKYYSLVEEAQSLT